MRGLGAGLGRRAEADRGPGRDQRRAVRLPAASIAAAIASGSWPSMGIVFQPEASKRFSWSVESDSDTAPSIEMPVVVPEDDQLVQPEVPGERDRFLADALHQAAVAGNHIGAVVDELVAELRVHEALGERHADRIGETLAERAGRGLDARGKTVFGMAGGPRAELAEALDLVDRHVLVAGEIEQRIKQHRAVAGRQHEAVAVRPVRLLRIVFQIAGEQHGGDVGAAHRQAGMAGIGLLDRIHGQEADRVGHPVVFLARSIMNCLRSWDFGEGAAWQGRGDT